jgi:hypothetical protein
MQAKLREMVEKRRQSAARLRFFDAGIWLGAPVGFPLAHDLPLETLERILLECSGCHGHACVAMRGVCGKHAHDKRGHGTQRRYTHPIFALASVLGKGFITGGLVSHWRGRTVSAQDGNLALERAAECLPADTYTVWTGLPLYPAEPGPLPGRGELPASVRAVRLFPRTHNYPLTDWVVGSLCRWLVEHRLPLFLWHVELDWPSLYALAGQYPELNIVIETQTQKILYHNRPLLALMQQRRNVLVETSNLVGPRIIEYCVRECGAERLIFGTFQPMNDPLVPIGMVIDAEISESDAALIAGGNLRRLIDGVKP